MEHGAHVELRREAEYLHHCLFGGDAPSALIAHYLNAHECLTELRDVPVEQLHTLHIIIGKQLDAVAIEPWLRRKGRRHVLSAKLLLVAYLVECSGGHVGFLRHARPGPGVLVSAVLCGFAGLLRGYYLKVRHGLV